VWETGSVIKEMRKWSLFHVLNKNLTEAIIEIFE